MSKYDRHADLINEIAYYNEMFSQEVLNKRYINKNVEQELKDFKNDIENKF